MDLESPSTRAAVLAACLCLAGVVVAEEPPARRAGVELVEVHLEPPAPAPDKLSTLEVILENHGRHTASLFAFSVEVAGRSLEVYGDALFVAELPPGERRRLKLFNVRMAPEIAAGDRLVVRLASAHWIEVEATDGAEAWTPLGPVEGLPSVLEVPLAPPREGT